jgi:miniconductance mechanosensitive channel
MLDNLAEISPILPMVVGVAGLLLAALVANYVIRRGLIALIHAMANRSSVAWDNALSRRKVFHHLTRVIPAIVIYVGITQIDGIGESILSLTQNVTMAFMALTVTLAVNAALNAGNDIYKLHPIARERPLKGIVQVAQIVVFVIGAVVVISQLVQKSPLILLSGFGAMTAVLLLVFKDTILGLVASLQLTANDMVRVGDWIEMPACGADGDVVEVALHTVKVQNWDKTITTIPTYKLISESFKNWRGMAEAGGRRIKRALYIDQQSIRFLGPEEVAGLERFSLLRDHLERKREELDEAAAALGEDGREAVNRRRLTNVGVFRAYVKAYVGSHPKLRHDLTTLVRQLPPGPEGLPIEIYCFTRTTDWLEYEDVQSDIFDHILAILSEFDLRLFQQPAGSDLEQLALVSQANGSAT